jgi:hypothetical protein
LVRSSFPEKIGTKGFFDDDTPTLFDSGWRRFADAGRKRMWRERRAMQQLRRRI